MVVVAVGVGADAGVDAFAGPEFGVAGACDCIESGLVCFEAPSANKEPLGVEAEVIGSVVDGSGVLEYRVTGGVAATPVTLSNPPLFGWL